MQKQIEDAKRMNAIKESLSISNGTQLRLKDVEFTEEEMFDETVLRALRNPNVFNSTMSRLIIEEVSVRSLLHDDDKMSNYDGGV